MKTTIYNDHVKTLNVLGVSEFLETLSKSPWDQKDKETVEQVLALGRLWIDAYRKQTL